MNICENCGDEHNGEYGSGRFCSTKCSRGFSTKAKRKEINEKVSKSLTKEKKYIKKECVVCGKSLEVINSIRSRKTCNSRCASKLNYGGLTSDIKKMYKVLCAFRFSLSDYPSEFEFELIKKYGWYTASNRGNNINGVSRDHTCSVHYGYKNKIDPYLISHPANCKLMQHSLNNKKNVKHNISLSELIKRVNKFNKKYNFKQYNKVGLINEENIHELYLTGSVVEWSKACACKA